MGLLLYTKLYNNSNLPLPPWCPRKHPYTQMVNRVMDGIDPFKYTLKCETLQSIIALPKNNYSYEEMSINRAIELKKLDGNIYIMYSGGVDSTTAVLSFMLSWTEQELKRVHILASSNSIKEFPQMWNNIYKNFKGRIYNSFDHIEKYCNKGYVITGELGDQVLGSDVIKKVVHFLGDEAIHKNWKDCMPIVYEKMFGPEIATNMIDVYSVTTSYSPVPIKSNFDWVWWFNFTNKWQQVKYRPLFLKPWVNQKENFNKIIHFFDTPLWQRWSIDNHDKKIENNLDSYKIVAKRFIVDKTGYTDYLQKSKIGSLSSLWVNKEYYDAIDTELNFINKETALEYINVQPT